MLGEVWILDDEKPICEVLSNILQDEGYQTKSFVLAKEFFLALNKAKPQAIFLDLWLRDGEGLEILENLRREHPEIPIIVISGHGTVETAVKAIKKGAFDFIEKPLSYDRVILTLKQALKFVSLEEENRRLRDTILGKVNLTGESTGIQELKRLIQRVAKLDTTVLIFGESGSGKEVVAKLIHLYSQRANQPFIEVNCAAVPETLIEAELFGYEKGAFTDAKTTKKGKFELAKGGTIFLDEIGDMSLNAQAKLLRVLQEKKIERLGASHAIPVDVRVIAATNRDLKAMIAQGKFREDLFYRLNVFPIKVPPLRERKEDIPHLVETFLIEFSFKIGHRIKKVSPEVLEALSNYHWPGNVRELKNFLERLVINVGEKETIEFSDLPPDFPIQRVTKKQNQENPEPWFAIDNFKLAKQEFEREYLRRKLEETSWNISRTAKLIGLERAYLQKKVRDLNLKIKP